LTPRQLQAHDPTPILKGGIEMLRAGVIAMATSIILSSPSAGEDGPKVIPERVQELAIKFPIAERLGIKWSAATPNDIGRYMGMLAATTEAATTIALKNGRKTPSDDDYTAAFAAFCFWPLNKPPLAEPYWDKAYGAFGNQKIRDSIQGAVGPLTVALPALIESGKASDVVLSEWPKTNADYLKGVLNFEGLANGQ